MDAKMTQTNASASRRMQNDAVRDLLTLASQLINQGESSRALQAVVVAIKTKGGDEAVIQSLDRARELHRPQQNSAVDQQLASLLAECAIAEVQPAFMEPSAK